MTPRGNILIDFHMTKYIIYFVIEGGPAPSLRRAMTPVRVGLFDN
jgi:hypothetical protein